MGILALHHHRRHQKLPKGKKGAAANRILVSVNVLGSAGPIRFVVSEEALVGTVISTALRSYAREGRRPVLGSDLDDFLLYCSYSDSALSPCEPIGSNGSRSFVLCKKQQLTPLFPGTASGTTASYKEGSPVAAEKKATRSFKAWINKSLSFKISSH